MLKQNKLLVVNGYGKIKKPSIHPEASNWLTRVTANNGTVSETTLMAVSNFCISIDNANLRDKFYRLNLFCGNMDINLSAVRTPLYLSPSPNSTLGNNIDINVNFVGGDYIETGTSGGLQGNSTNKFLRTGLLGNILSQDDCHLSLYGDTLAGEISTRPSPRPIGVRTSVSLARIEIYTGNNFAPALAFVSSNTGTFSASGPPITAGHIIGTSISNQDIRVFANGSQSGNTTTVTRDVTGVVPIEFLIFALNVGSYSGSTVTGSAFNHTAARLSAYSIGKGLTTQQSNAFYIALHSFQTSLGRQK